MSEDLIKRSDAIGAITNHCENECYYRVDNWCPQCQREEFEEAIKAVPSADRPTWIPCSERLPREDGFYLVTITDGEQISVCKMPFVESEWKGNWFDDEVIAWMQLPSAYQGEGADDE